MDVRVPAEISEARDRPAIHRGSEVVGRGAGAKCFHVTRVCMEGGRQRLRQTDTGEPGSPAATSER